MDRNQKTNPNNNNNSSDKEVSTRLKENPKSIQQYNSVEDFIKRQLQLVEIERKEEADTYQNVHQLYSATQLARSGICLRKLQVNSVRTGLGGKVLVDFCKNFDQSLPGHKFTSGDIVALKQHSGAKQEEDISGICYRISEKKITVAFKEFPDDLNDEIEWNLFKMGTDVPYQRTKAALNKLSNASTFPCKNIIEILYGDQMPRASKSFKPVLEIDRSLNGPQREAVEFCLGVTDVGLIFGPPGTGKTTTVVEFMLQAALRGDKILACGPSNLSVDNMVEKLAEKIQNLKNQKKKPANLKIPRILRLGHAARLLESILCHSLDMKVHNSDSAVILKDIKKDFDNTLEKLKKSRNRQEKFKLRSELKELKKELIQREHTTVSETIKSADIIFTTTTGAEDKHLHGVEFDLVLIDEAAQAQESNCWIPALKGRTLILAGDSCQLGPVIKSQEAEDQGLGETMFQRIIEKFGGAVTRMLTIQYRMNETIMAWPSSELYENKLEADLSVKTGLLSDLPHIQKNETTKAALVYIDTCGCDLEESAVEGKSLIDAESKSNEGEAEVTVEYLNNLVRFGLKPEDIAIITPYNGQVALLKKKLSSTYPGLEIGSVDGFQGREKEAVIISFVRSNPHHEIGFLSENRRTNVAITRAKKHLCLIGDSETLVTNPFLERLIDYAHEFGEVRSPNPDKFSLGMPKEKKKPVIKKEKEKEEDTLPLKVKHPNEYNQFFQTLKMFANNPTQHVLDLPASLSSLERAIVHEIADLLKLNHQSSGKGKSRAIQISKKDLNTRLTISQKEVQKQEKEEKERKEKEKEERVVQKEEKEIEKEKEKEKEREKEKEEIGEKLIEKKEKKEEKQELTSGEESSDDEEQKVNKTQPPVEHGSSSSKNKKKNKKKKKNKTQQTNNPPKEKKLVENKISNDLDEMVEQNKSCRFINCKKPLFTLAQQCEFCKLMFCLTHAMPEIHGCGAEIRRKAQQEFRREFKASQDQTGPKLKPASQEVKQKVLKDKLKKKIEEKSSTRSVAPKKKKGK